ncbi:MAG TPA: cytochrome c [Bryobacteraceae bacterium]|jgi:ubiquinol-cytochrome c reductase cytochrome c subunit|nr:cytochrome c [Bryobacteraceae bacterium]
MRVSLIFIAAAVLWAQTRAPERSKQQTTRKDAAAPAGDAAKGKKLFTATGCYECHGYVGQGGTAGPRIAPDPIPFPAFSAYLRHPANQMPPYTEKVASNQDLADIYAYLKTIPQPPSPDSIPLLKK